MGERGSGRIPDFKSRSLRGVPREPGVAKQSAGGQVAKEKRKSRKNYLARELKANEGIIPRFVAGEAFHTCATLGCGRIATPTLLVLFSQKSTEIHDTVNNLFIESVGKAVILYNSAFVHMRFFTGKPVQNDRIAVYGKAQLFRMTGQYFLLIQNKKTLPVVR